MAEAAMCDEVSSSCFDDSRPHHVPLSVLDRLRANRCAERWKDMRVGIALLESGGLDSLCCSRSRVAARGTASDPAALVVSLAWLGGGLVGGG